MGKELRNKINELDDSHAVKLFNFFGEQLLSGLKENDLTVKIDPELKTDKNLNKIITLDSDVMLKNLSPAESALVARNFLLYVVDDATLSPLLQKALDEFKEKHDLIVGAILAVGFAASMLIFACTTGLEAKFGNATVIKRPASPAIIKAIMEPFTKILDKI
jgi:hypothetical protein